MLDMTRHYGLKIGDIVTEHNRKGKVVDLDIMDNNRVVLELENGERVNAVAEWCKKVENFTVALPRELLVDEEEIVSNVIAPKIAVIEKQVIDRAVQTMLAKQNIKNIHEAQKLGYDILVNRDPGGGQVIQLVKRVDQIKVSVSVCTR